MTASAKNLPARRSRLVVSMTVDGAPLALDCPCRTCAEIARTDVAHYTVDRRGAAYDITRTSCCEPIG